MPLAIPAGTRLVGRTQALRTNWCWYRPAKLLVDCGDGCTADLGDLVGSPATLALTHGHGDHILSVPALAAARQMPSLVTGGPLQILYPAGMPQASVLQQAIRGLWPFTTFDRISWHPIEPGYRQSLGRTRELVAFATQHLPPGAGPTLGYAVVEHRTRLAAALRGAAPEMIREVVATQGRAATQEAYQVTEFLHTGDSRVLAPEDLPLGEQADLVVVDTTFLTPADRDEPTHAAVTEVLDALRDAPIRRLILHHLSQRYDRQTLVAEVRHLVEASGWDPARVVLWDDTTFTSMTPDAPAASMIVGPT